jgi:hypothetical protein
LRASKNEDLQMLNVTLFKRVTFNQLPASYNYNKIKFQRTAINRRILLCSIW